MPHCFALLLTTLDASRKFFESWAGFMRGVVEGGEGEGKVETRGTVVRAKTLQEVSVDVEGLCGDGREVVLERMKREVGEISGRQQQQKQQPDLMARL